MSEKIFNNQNITAYLLGSLPDAETEVFDELSITDEQFADELKATEKDLVDAYVNGELKDEKLEQFKSYYLASPIRHEKVEFAKNFQIFAKQNIAQTETSSPIQTKSKQTLLGFLSNMFTFSNRAWQFGLAFSVLALMLFGGWLWSENSRLRTNVDEAKITEDKILQREADLQEREKQLQTEIANQRTNIAETEKELETIRTEKEQLLAELKREKEQKRSIEKQQIEPQKAEIQKQTPNLPSRLISVASFILTPSLRGNSPIQTLSIPPKTDSIFMQLELETGDYKFCRVVLKNESSNQIVWRSGKIKTKLKGTNNFLNINFPAKLLKSQTYSIEVSGLNSNGEAEIIGNYPFRTVLK